MKLLLIMLLLSLATTASAIIFIPGINATCMAGNACHVEVKYIQCFFVYSKNFWKCHPMYFDGTNVKFDGDIYDSDTGRHVMYTLNEPPPPPIPTVTTPGKGTLLLLGLYLIMFFLAPKHTLLLVFFSVPVILLFRAIKPLIF